MAGEVALEAADCLAGALAFAAAPGDVVAGRLVAACAGDDHAVQRGVDLTVAAPVESLALGVSRAGRDRRDAGGAGEPWRASRAGAAGAQHVDVRVSAPSARARQVRQHRRARSETAPASPKHAGSPPAPTRVPGRARAPTAATPRSPSHPTGRSARRAAHRSTHEPRRSCATACECPHRARSLTSSTSTSTRLDARRTRLAGGDATLLSSHAGTSPTGDERHSERQSSPTADSLKESQLAAGRTIPSASDITDEPNHNSKPEGSRAT